MKKQGEKAPERVVGREAARFGFSEVACLCQGNSKLMTALMRMVDGSSGIITDDVPDTLPIDDSGVAPSRLQPSA